MHDTEFTFYKVLVLLSSAASIAFGITNIVYFNKIRLDNNCPEISSGTATTLLWLNIILVILSSIVFFWSIFRLIFTGKEEKDIVNKKYNNYTHNYPVSSNGDGSTITQSPTGTTITSFPNSPI